MTKLKDIEAKAKDYYFNMWRGHEIIIPAFGEKVYLNRNEKIIKEFRKNNPRIYPKRRT